MLIFPVVALLLPLRNVVLIKGLLQPRSAHHQQPRLQSSRRRITVILSWYRCSASRLWIGKLIAHPTARFVAESDVFIVPIDPEVSRVIAFTRTLFFFDLHKVFFRAILGAESVVSDSIALPSIRLQFASRQLEARATCCRALYHALEGLVATGVGDPQCSVQGCNVKSIPTTPRTRAGVFELS